MPDRIAKLRAVTAELTAAREAYWASKKDSDARRRYGVAFGNQVRMASTSLPTLLDIVEAAKNVVLQSGPSTALAPGWRATQATALDHLTAVLDRLTRDVH